MKNVKNMKNFTLNENLMDDFKFKTDLTHREIYFTNYEGSPYEDYDDFSANVYWHLSFDWMGEVGIDYTIYVDKVEVEYTGINYDKDDEEIREEQTLVIDDPDKIEINTDTPRSTQIIANEITIDKDSVEVVF